MRVVVLGAGTGVPARDHSPAGVYVQIAHEHVLLDAGAGTLQRLRRAGVTYLDLDRVFLTHYHPDHCLDLVSILFAARLPEPARTKPLTIYGPRGLRRLLRAFHRAYPNWLKPRTYRLNVKEVGEGTLWLPGYTVRTRRMNHYDTGALGYRLEAAGKRVVYSGDTETCQGIVELGEDADVLVLECSVPDRRKVAGCRRLVLTHFYPVFRGYDIRGRVRRAYRGPLTLARDLTSIRL